MSLQDLEELLRKYLSAGIAVVLVILSPGAVDRGSPPPGPSVNVVEPDSVPERRDDLRPEASRSGPDARRPSDPVPATPAEPEQADPPPRGAPQDRTDDRAHGRTGADGRDPAHEADPQPGDSRDDHTEADDDTDTPEGSTERGTADEGTTAADRHGWGTPNREDDFTGGLEQWTVYDGPGHAGQGRRSPAAAGVENGILTITGDSSGTTAGMAWNPGQKYGRWEGRVRAPASDPSYNALLLLWPDAEDFPVGGEIDFMEMLDHTRRTTDIFIHYGEDNSQVNGQVEIDATEWHNWAVEWTPQAITAYIDGEEWYRTTDTSIFPPRPMHLCIQLDWFPEASTPEESYMHVDWVRQYSLDSGTG